MPRWRHAETGCAINKILGRRRDRVVLPVVPDKAQAITPGAMREAPPIWQLPRYCEIQRHRPLQIETNAEGHQTASFELLGQRNR